MGSVERKPDVGVRPPVSEVPVQKVGELPGGQKVTPLTGSGTGKPLSEILKKAEDDINRAAGKALDNPPVITRLYSLLAGIRSFSCMKVINYISDYFYFGKVGREFHVNSLSEFKGASKAGDYYLSEREGGSFLAGAPSSAKDLLSSQKIDGPRKFTNQEGIKVRVPCNFAKDLSRMKMTICGMDNKDCREPEGKAHNDNLVSNCQGIKSAFEKEGIGEDGFFASLELAHQGITGDLMTYLNRFNDVDKNYVQHRAEASIEAGFRWVGANKVFRIDLTVDVPYGRVILDTPGAQFLKQESVSIKRTIDIPVESLKKVKVMPKQGGIENGYTFSNIPKDVTGRDVWEPSKHVSTVELKDWMDHYSQLIAKDPKSVSIDDVKQWIENSEKAYDKPDHFGGRFFGVDSVPANVKHAMVLHCNKEVLDKEFPGLKEEMEKAYLANVNPNQKVSGSSEDANNWGLESVQDGLKKDFGRSLANIHVFVDTPQSSGIQELSVTTINPSWDVLNDALTRLESAVDNLTQFNVYDKTQRTLEENHKSRTKSVVSSCLEIFKEGTEGCPAVAKLLANPTAAHFSSEENRKEVLSELISKMERLIPKMDALVGDRISYKDVVEEKKMKVKNLREGKPILAERTREDFAEILVDPKRTVKNISLNWQEQKRKDTAEAIASWLSQTPEIMSTKLQGLYIKNNTPKKVAEKVAGIIKGIDDLKNGTGKSRVAVTKEIFIERNETGELKVVYKDPKSALVRQKMTEVLNDVGFVTGSSLGHHEDLACQVLRQLEGSKKEEKIEVLKAIRLAVSGTPLEMLTSKDLRMKLSDSHGSRIEVAKDKEGDIFVKHTQILKIMTDEEVELNDGWDNVGDKNLSECNILFDIKNKLCTYSLSPVKTS